MEKSGKKWKIVEKSGKMWKRWNLEMKMKLVKY
jgi:hypothetical protein